ncbi:MAG TPA: LysR family transcriptional regulator, partial [Rhizobacter sp.]|nr:LysR family transcriptional regulator [Rhizobacter sp.]
GLMLQATEQNLGRSVVRELLAADALVAGRLVQLSPLTIPFEAAYVYHLVHPPALQGWAPLVALRSWLREELEASMRALHPPARKLNRARTRPAGR